jgi:hypothetical protein
MAQNQAPSLYLTVAALARPGAKRNAGELATITMNGQRKDEFSLAKNQKRSYAARLGRITVQIVGGNVHVSNSPCRHKICLYSPPISLSGERIICAPNHFLLEVGGNTVDTVIG